MHHQYTPVRQWGMDNICQARAEAEQPPHAQPTPHPRNYMERKSCLMPRSLNALVSPTCTRCSAHRAGKTWQLTAAVGALRFRDSSGQERSRSEPWPRKSEPDERYAQLRQTLQPSTPVSDAEKSAFPESDCLVTADAVPAVKVPRHPTEGASSMVETDRWRPYIMFVTLVSCKFLYWF